MVKLPLTRWHFAFTFALMLLVAGCRQRGDTPPAPRSDVPAAAITVTQTPAPVVVPDTGDAGTVLNQLSSELRKYVVSTRTAPKNFEEFVAKARVQAPAPPTGKKYAIQSGSVVLIDQ